MNDNDNNNQAHDSMMQEQPDEQADTSPEFITADDAVEVAVHDDTVPMEEEDDEDDKANNQENAMSDAAAADSTATVDMAQATLTTHTGPVYAVQAFYHAQQSQQQGLSIVSGGGDDKAMVHRITSSSSSSESHTLAHQHTDSVSAVAWNLPYLLPPTTESNNNNNNSLPLLAVGAYDGAICLYHAETLQPHLQFEGPTDVECLAFHPKGGTVLLVGSAADGTVWMYHITLNKCLQVFVGHEQAVTACGFSEDGKWALSASADGSLRVWAPRTGNCKHAFTNMNGTDQVSAGLTCMDVGGGADQALVVVGAEDGKAHVCHVGTKKVVATLTHYEVPSNQQPNNDNDDAMELPMSVEAVGFAKLANAVWCATAGVDGVLKIWDLGSGSTAQCRQVCRHPSSASDSNGGAPGITRLQWHPTLPLVFVSTTEGSVMLWDARNGELLITLTGHTNVINDLHIQYTDSTNYQKAIIVTGSDDHTVKVFEVDLATVWKG